MPSFTPRTTSPGGLYKAEYMTDGTFAVHPSYWNTCIYGSPVVVGATSLANCVGYAQGRLLEAYREVTGYNPDATGTHPFISLNADPEFWPDRARLLGYDVNLNPSAGCVYISEVYYAGGVRTSHVGFIESYDPVTRTAYCSESGYGGPEFSYSQSLYYNEGKWYSDFIGGREVVAFIHIPEIEPPTPPQRKKRKVWMMLRNINNDFY